jgi:hypothetical protein
MECIQHVQMVCLNLPHELILYQGLSRYIFLSGLTGCRNSQREIQDGNVSIIDDHANFWLLLTCLVSTVGQNKHFDWRDLTAALVGCCRSFRCKVTNVSLEGSSGQVL